MNKLQFAVLWEDQGSETVVYGPFKTWNEAERYKFEIMADINTELDDDTAEEYGHKFSIVNFIEVKK